MSNPIRSIKHRARYIIEPIQQELGRLRLKVEEQEDRLRRQRRAITMLEEELAFVRGQHERMLQRRLNGGA